MAIGGRQHTLGRRSTRSCGGLGSSFRAGKSIVLFLRRGIVLQCVRAANGNLRDAETPSRLSDLSCFV
ncbi:unnamed protein product [Periconia digitata]|uniref:Uncharacterized protein n=1 Tax=Periconia digitata TaxID=1303443 RepID=A0A9W4UBH0_9PLEO|nr:unnamed protein product [Periconia digitata]